MLIGNANAPRLSVSLSFIYVVCACLQNSFFGFSSEFKKYIMYTMDTVSEKIDAKHIKAHGFICAKAL
jgi:hypothetical protein